MYEVSIDGGASLYRPFRGGNIGLKTKKELVMNGGRGDQYRQRLCKRP